MRALANAGISINAVSAYYHDHFQPKVEKLSELARNDLFVPHDKASDAMRVLKKILKTEKIKFV